MRGIVAAALLAACNAANPATDGGAPDASDAEAGCLGNSVEQYCQAQSCPTDPASDTAGWCTACGTYNCTASTQCGYTFASRWGIDTGKDYVFGPDGGLIAVYSSMNGITTCMVGPSSSGVPDLTGCPVVSIDCDGGVADAAASDAGAD